MNVRVTYVGPANRRNARSNGTLYQFRRLVPQDVPEEDVAGVTGRDAVNWRAEWPETRDDLQTWVNPPRSARRGRRRRKTEQPTYGSPVNEE